jgi:hypothetical protein
MDPGTGGAFVRAPATRVSVRDVVDALILIQADQKE